MTPIDQALLRLHASEERNGIIVVDVQRAAASLASALAESGVHLVTEGTLAVALHNAGIACWGGYRGEPHPDSMCLCSEHPGHNSPHPAVAARLLAALSRDPR